MGSLGFIIPPKRCVHRRMTQANLAAIRARRSATSPTYCRGFYGLLDGLGRRDKGSPKNISNKRGRHARGSLPATETWRDPGNLPPATDRNHPWPQNSQAQSPPLGLFGRAHLNFYKHHLGDYADATAHLSWDEDLAYRRLLSVYYRSEAPIPASQACRLVRAVTPAQKKAVATVLREFFTNGGGRWKNSRADNEIAAYQHQVSVNRKTGKLGGRPKRIETESVSDTKPNRNRTVTLTKNQIPEPERSKARSRARARATPLPSDFKISDRVKTWAAQKGFANLPAYLEFFTGRMKANGKTYSDWDEALMNCIREDWPKLRSTTPAEDAKMKPLVCRSCGSSQWGSLVDGRCQNCRTE